MGSGGLELKHKRAESAPTKHTGRKRYRGQGKRGQQPRAQLDAQDFRTVREVVATAEAGLGMAAVPSLSCVARDELEQASCSQIELAIRYLQGVLARHPSLQKKRELARRGGMLNGPVATRSMQKK